MINRRYGDIITIVNYIIATLISLILIFAMCFKIAIGVPTYIFILFLAWCFINLLLEIRRKSYTMIILSVFYAGIIIIFLVLA